MASSFYFFTQPDLLQAQTAGQAYGPVLSSDPDYISGTDGFRVTSLHTATTDANAYAVCDSVIFIQAQGSFLNIILKPLTPPPFQLPKVRFYIYRGIKTTSIIDSSVPTNIAAATSNDLTNAIWDSTNKMNASAGTSSTPNVAAVGLDLSSQPGTNPLDSVFYREGSGNQFPIVRAGWQIGKFDSTAPFGFEIIFEGMGFEPTLANARAAKTVVSTNSLPGTPTAAQTFEYWSSKEAVLFYMDPCSFFGGFYKQNLSLGSTQPAGTSGVTITTLSGNDIYDLVLTKYINQNTIWLDIRNECNLSFNYFKNYDVNIQMAFDGTSALSITNFYTSGWPLLGITNNMFASGNTGKSNVIRISMPDGAGDNPLPLMYISAGIVTSDFPNETTGAGKLISLTVTSGLTNEISLSTYNRDSLSGTTSIAGYIRLKYCKQFDQSNLPPVSSGTVLRAQHYLDNIFRPLDMKIYFPNSYKISTAYYEEEKFIDTTLAAAYNELYIIKLGIAQDTTTVQFVFYPIIRQSSTTITPNQTYTLTSEKDSVTDSYLQWIAQRTRPLVLNERQVSDGGQNENILVIIDDPSEYTGGFADVNSNELTPVMMSISEFASLQSLATNTLNFYQSMPVFLGVTNRTQSTDPSGQAYTTFDLTLNGYQKINAGTGSEAYQVNSVNTNIKLYCYGSF